MLSFVLCALVISQTLSGVFALSLGEVAEGLQRPLLSVTSLAHHTREEEGPLPFEDPEINGGVMSAFHAGGHRKIWEPINVIISGESGGKIPRPDFDVRGGVVSWLSAIGLDRECLNLHRGRRLSANLGDGQGMQLQKFLYRQQHTPNKWHDFLGACAESLVGGNHLRGYYQNSTEAWFFAVSVEKDASRNHMIVNDGYNLGRDQLVKAARQGGWLHGCYFAPAKIEYLEGMTPKYGWNHGIPTDGKVALITVDPPVGPFCS